MLLMPDDKLQVSTNKSWQQMQRRMGFLIMPSSSFMKSWQIPVSHSLSSAHGSDTSKGQMADQMQLDLLMFWPANFAVNM